MLRDYYRVDHTQVTIYGNPSRNLIPKHILGATLGQPKSCLIWGEGNQPIYGTWQEYEGSDVGHFTSKKGLEWTARKDEIEFLPEDENN